MQLSQFQFTRQKVSAEVRRSEVIAFCVRLHIAVSVIVNPCIKAKHLDFVLKNLEPLLALNTITGQQQGKRFAKFKCSL